MPGKANSAFMKPLKLTADLEAVVGNGPMPRSEVVKKLWAYIKKNGLQDQKNKRKINADAKLKLVNQKVPKNTARVTPTETDNAKKIFPTPAPPFLNVKKPMFNPINLLFVLYTYKK